MKKFKIGISFFVLVFVCVVLKNVVLLVNYILALALHELAHLFVAFKRGYSLKFIKLDIFGLAIELNEKIDNDDSFAINVAGPLFNLFLCLVCVALYWLVPASFKILNGFCFSNLVLAVFNLLPIYPLDGGKLLKTFFKEEKSYKRTDTILRSSIAGVFLILFILSLFKVANIFFLLMVIFLLTSKVKTSPTLSIFKYTKAKNIEKVVIVKANAEANLFSLIKQIKQNQYTIFYYKNDKNNYIDQDTIIDLATKHKLTTTMKEIY